MNEQLELIKEIIIVTCGNCGDVLLHRGHQEEITCPHCTFTSEPCNFPDFMY
jgi:predicted RNA-binding Zn-ribbon protein involved in translation (DUF1610 family)